MKIIAYATNKDGEGRVQEIGQYESIEDIEIIVGFYSKDVIITFEQEYEKND